MFSVGKNLNVHDAAKYIGYSEGGLRKLLKSGVIPYTKPAGRIYISKDNLDRFISNEL